MRTLRWILVVPAAFLAAVLVTFPLHWLVVAIGSAGFNPLAGLAPDALERLLYAFGVPYAFVLGAAFVAPRFRARTGTVAAISFGAIAAMLLAWAFGQPELAAIGPTWARVAAPLLWATGLVLGFLVTRRADEWSWSG